MKLVLALSFFVLLTILQEATGQVSSQYTCIVLIKCTKAIMPLAAT